MVIEEIIQNSKLNFFNKQNLALLHSAASIHCTFKVEFLALATLLLYDPCRKHGSWTLLGWCHCMVCRWSSLSTFKTVWRQPGHLEHCQKERPYCYTWLLCSNQLQYDRSNMIFIEPQKTESRKECHLIIFWNKSQWNHACTAILPREKKIQQKKWETYLHSATTFAYACRTWWLHNFVQYK